MKRSPTCLQATAILALGILALSPARADYPSTLQALGPLGYWRLNETAPSSDIAATLVGTTTGSYLGFTGRTPTTGALNLDSNEAQTFNGTSAYVETAYDPQLNTTVFSAEIWAKPSTLSATDGFATLMSSGQPAASPNRTGWVLYQAGGGTGVLSFRAYVNAGATTTAGDANGINSPAEVGKTLVAGVWNHVVVTNDGAMMKVYLNGSEIASGVSTSYVPATIGGTSIGRRFGINANRFPGDLDEGAFYNTVLSPARVLAHYNEGITRTTGYSGFVLADSPVAYYRLGEAAYVPPVATNIGSLAALANGVYNAGTTNNQAGPPNPPYTGMGVNTAVSFGGTGNINCGNDVGFDVPALSVSAWVKSSGFVNNMAIIGKGSLWRLTCNGAANTLTWTFPGGSVTGTRPVADGFWHHVVATADESGSALYVDGGLDASGGSFNGSSDASAVTLASRGNAGEQWIGTLDEAAVFPSALSGLQVANLYAARINSIPNDPLFWAPQVGGGGAGIWSSGSTVWAASAGVQGSSAQGTSGALVFGGAAGTVTINGSVASPLGLKFLIDGYNLVPGAPTPSLSLTGTSPIDNTVVVEPGVTASISAPVAGTTGMAKQGDGTLVLGGAGSLSGGASLSGGTLRLKHQNALQNATVTVNAGILEFDSSVAGNAFSFGGLGGGGAFDLENTAAAPVALTIGSNNASTLYSGSLNGDGSLTKGGSGVFSLRGTNNHAGTTVLSGTINPWSRDCFGTRLTLAGGVTFNQGNPIGFEGNSSGGAFTCPFVLSGGEVAFDVNFGSSKDIWTNTVISGPGSIKVFGGGRTQGLNLQGVNTFTGGLIIAGPDTPNVSIFNNSSLGTGTLASTMTAADVTRGGLRILGNLSGIPNAIDLGPTAAHRLVVNTGPDGGNFKATFTGPVSGSGGLVKIGNGTLTLAATNSYTGTTRVNGGRLLLNGANSGTAAVTVNADGRLGGKGSKAAAVTVASLGGLVLDVVDWAAASTGLTVNTLALPTGNSWTVNVSSDTDFGDFTETNKTLPIITAAGGITGFDAADVTISPDANFPGDGGWDIQKTGNTLELVYTASIPEDYVTWAAGFLPANVANPAGDFDGDGQTNHDEYAFGLDPTKGSSVNPFTVPFDPSTGTFSYTRRLPSLTGLVDRYQWSTDLGGWTNFSPASVGTNLGDPIEVITIGVPAVLLDNPALFIRLKAN
jgi:autotransporter-associated beta strand protein